jgi:DNA-binding NtrC family response regulator
MYIPVKFTANEFSSGGGSKGARAAKPTNGVHRRPTILLVEDEILLRAAVAEFLRDSNYRVLEASNAVEAQAVMQSKEPIELVFSDVRMPGELSGFDLAAWIRQQYPDVSVLLTSGFFDLQSASGYGKEHGLILQKPYSFDELLAHVKRLLLS